MDYIVFDLEWNQPTAPHLTVMDPFKLSGEIIQFGAVKIRNLEDIEVVDTYTAIVKPIYYTKMNKNVEEVTELTDEMVMQGRPFPEVCKEFLEWCGEDFAFISWSPNDIYMLEDNMSIHGMDVENLPECYDIQLVFDDQVTQDGKDNALSYAMWRFEIKPNRSHDALNDAMNTVEVMRRLDFSEGVEGYEV